jgi:hypothetical protein
MNNQFKLMSFFVVVAATQIASVGCTSVQLRKSTIAHSMTLEEIYTQQVLNNLAMFVKNPDALPSFAYPNQGTTAIQDMGSFGNPGYISKHFVSSPFSSNVSRQATENWVLTPVSDPAKLALMRCAYRQVIASCMGADYSGAASCPNCKRLRRDFYGPPDADVTNPAFNEEQPCLNSGCWFHWGCKEHVPKDCQCPYVGEYCGLYLWVCPEGREMLTRLTLAILDYAVNDPKQFTKRTKVVELYLNLDGTINYESKGIKLTATIPIDVPSNSIVTLDKSAAYGKFLTLFGKSTADRLVSAAPQINPMYDQWDKHMKSEFWQSADPNDSHWPADLKPAVKFVVENGILPFDVPTEEVLRGPAVYEQKGSASAGLQQLGQRLNAASPSTPVTGK